jgi:endonuclease/exonuclease/phosphatase family metal-dependent hydrolase
LHEKTKLLVLCVLSGIVAGSETIDAVWRGGYGATVTQSPEQIKVVTWNIERGLQFEAIAKFLESAKADLLLFQEVDVNARRSGNRRVHEELARRLGMQFAFAPEFEELGQRVSSARAYQGQALLSHAPITASRAIRFVQQSNFWEPRWYLPNWAVLQRRVGGRLALGAEVSYGSMGVVVFNVHLESRGPESIRLQQIQDVLRDASAYPRDRLVILAGDLNVNGATSPVIQAIEQSGFRRAAGAEVTTLRGEPLDWIFVRGQFHFADAKVHREILAADHFPVSVTISLPPAS